MMSHWPGCWQDNKKKNKMKWNSPKKNQASFSILCCWITDLEAVADKILLESVDQETGRKHIMDTLFLRYACKRYLNFRSGRYLFLRPACKKYFNFRPENWGKNISFCDDKSWTLYFSDFPAKNIWKRLFFKTRFQSHQVFRHPLYFLWLFSFCQCWWSWCFYLCFRPSWS